MVWARNGVPAKADGAYTKRGSGVPRPLSGSVPDAATELLSAAGGWGSDSPPVGAVRWEDGFCCRGRTSIGERDRNHGHPNADGCG